MYFRLAAMKVLKGQEFSEITPEQFGILFFLSQKNGIYQRQLCLSLMKDRANVTRMINILEEKGFVYREKDAVNKRITKVFITEKGLEKAKILTPLRDKLIEKATLGISKDEQKKLMQLLEKVRVNLEDLVEIQT